MKKEKVVGSNAWQKLFETTRPENHAELMIVTSGGFQIAVQEVLRADQSVLLLRGRIGGQAETGLMFILPYDEISLAYVKRPVLTEEVELFSPDVSRERKDQIAKQVADALAKAKEDSLKQDQDRDSKDDVPGDLVKQLEDLRQSAGLGSPIVADSPESESSPEPATPGVATPMPALPSASPGGLPKLPKKPGLPPKFKKS